MIREDPTLAFLLGKPPKAASLFSDVFRKLEAAGLKVRLHLPHEADTPLPEWLPEVALVAHRGLRLEVVQALARHAAGLRCCNEPSAVLGVYDRDGLHRRLKRSGLPTPGSQRLESWPEALAFSPPLVVKAVSGWQGRGSGVAIFADDPLPLEAPFAGPYLLQDLVPGDGFDHKLYVAGERVFGLLKAARGGGVGRAQPFEPDAALSKLARDVGACLGLDIYGVDVVRGPQGPSIVDVNPFPGCQGDCGGCGKRSRAPDRARALGRFARTRPNGQSEGDLLGLGDAR